MYDELIKKFNAIDTSKLVKKHIIVLRSRILKIKYLVLLTQLLMLLLILKLMKLKVKYLVILAQPLLMLLMLLKIRYPTVVIQLKKNYHVKITDIRSKYFTTSEYIKFTNNILDTKITKKNQLLNLVSLIFHKKEDFS